MYEDYDVYRFAIESLDNLLKKIISCQKDIIKYHQNNIDEIKKDSNLSSREKQIKIKSYLSSIHDVHNLLKQNNNIINHMSSYVEKLHNNVNNLITGNLEDYVDLKSEKDSISLNSINKVLFAVIEEEKEKINRIKEETDELLAYMDISSSSEKHEIFEKECRKLYHLKDEINTMISSINLDESNTKSKELIIEYVNKERDRITNISKEAYNILGYKYEELVESDKFDIFIELLRGEHNKIIELINDMDYIGNSLKDLNTQDKVAFNLYKNIVEEEARKLGFTIDVLDEICPSKEDIENIPVLDENTSTKDEIIEVIDSENKRIEEYSKKIKEVLSNLKNGSSEPKEAIARLSDIYINESQEMGNKAETTENLLENKVDPNIREKDTLEYKKIYSLLNKSFWIARQKASEEKIKYPSALYEKTVREYQNQILIDEYNISLEKAEDIIEEYKEKYASDIYMDDIYNEAMSILREELSLSIQELCDESNGISLLDKKAYELLDRDLNNINDEILACNENDINDGLTINEYKNKYKLNKLQNKKDIIENQMFFIKRREKRLDNGYF